MEGRKSGHVGSGRQTVLCSKRNRTEDDGCGTLSTLKLSTQHASLKDEGKALCPSMSLRRRSQSRGYIDTDRVLNDRQPLDSLYQ